MKLTVWLPTEVLLEEEVSRIKAEAQNGWFGMLPKHVDFVTALVPGVLTFEPQGRAEEYLAVDRGILVKCGDEVKISTRNAVRGPNLEQLKTEVEKRFREREEAEKKARAFEAKLETDLVRRLLEEEKRA
ncbi:MAG TPA: F0F1 ATP synthase subunit epsilon [Bryobacteraceae bacterium]|nr:F0F1 ATP synthase subunit epsilon [Bryobacteraceae bacterium]